MLSSQVMFFGLSDQFLLYFDFASNILKPLLILALLVLLFIPIFITVALVIYGISLVEHTRVNMGSWEFGEAQRKQGVRIICLLI